MMIGGAGLRAALAQGPRPPRDLGASIAVRIASLPQRLVARVNLRGVSNRDFDHHHLLHAERLVLYFPMPDQRRGFFSHWRSCCDNIFSVSRRAFQAPP
jgi:hypothetical protein